MEGFSTSHEAIAFCRLAYQLTVRRLVELLRNGLGDACPSFVFLGFVFFVLAVIFSVTRRAVIVLATVLPVAL